MRAVFLAFAACSADPTSAVEAVSSPPSTPSVTVPAAPVVNSADAAASSEPTPQTPQLAAERFTPGSQLVASPSSIASGRAQVSQARARVYPYSAIGLVVPAYCTITLIGPHTAMTAAHCVWDRNAGPLREGYRTGAPIPITAVYFGLAEAACGSVASYTVVHPIPRLAIPDAYTDPKEPNATNWDFAFVDFAPRDKPGNVVGWYGTHVDHGEPLYLVGYPSDEEGNTSLWERGPGTAGDAFGGSLPDVFVHDLDVTRGDSGACVSTWTPAVEDTESALGWRVCTGVQAARVAPSGPNLARAWDVTLHQTAASLGDWP